MVGQFTHTGICYVWICTVHIAGYAAREVREQDQQDTGAIPMHFADLKRVVTDAIANSERQKRAITRMRRFTETRFA